MTFCHSEEKGEQAPSLWKLWPTESVLLFALVRNVVGTSQNASGLLHFHQRLGAHSFRAEQEPLPRVEHRAFWHTLGA